MVRMQQINFQGGVKHLIFLTLQQGDGPTSHLARTNTRQADESGKKRLMQTQSGGNNAKYSKSDASAQISEKYMRLKKEIKRFEFKDGVARNLREQNTYLERVCRLIVV